MKGGARYSVSFGESLAAGNFGRGHYDDLAIGWSKRIDGYANSGAVSVLYGSPSGLTGAQSQLWTQVSPGLRGRPGIAFDFGAGLAGGNFGRGHLDDLAISAAGETVGGKRYAGALYVLYGSASGLTATHAQRWTQSSPFVAGTPMKEGWFAAALVAANLGRGPQDDLAVGESFATVGRYRRAGEFHVFFGTPTGLRAKGGQLWTLNTPGVHGRARAKRGFGDVGCAAHFGRGRWADLVETEDDQPPHNSYGPGAVQVLYGSPRGLTGVGVQRWREGEHGIPGTRTAYDLFGHVACG
ncbi:MAG: hypothetical protein M3Q23_12460 [Actinomycetota bacterium]|nr:hypothetical protein [Actinomycetota bacterium]